MSAKFRSVANRTLNLSQCAQLQFFNHKNVVSKLPLSLDTVRPGRGKAKAGVEPGMAEDNHHIIPRLPAHVYAGSNKLGTNTQPLPVRMDGHRTESNQTHGRFHRLIHCHR